MVYETLIHLCLVDSSILDPGLIYLSCNIREHTFRNVHPAKIKISLCNFAVWSESSLGTFYLTKDAKVLHADNEDSGWSVQMCRLI